MSSRESSFPFPTGSDRLALMSLRQQAGEQCHTCGQTSTQYTTKFRGDKVLYYCKPCEHPVHSDLNLGKSLFGDLTLDHVMDEFGKPVRVTSRRQLLEAEKRYKFRSLIGHSDEANFDKPPQGEHRKLDEIMFDEKKWLYPDVARAMLKEMKEKGDAFDPPSGMRK